MSATTEVEHEMWRVSEITPESVILSRTGDDDGVSIPRELFPGRCDEGDRYRLVEGFVRAS